MMNRMENLYRQIIMEHYKNPRNKGLVDDERYNKSHIRNPSCGDDVTIQTLVEGGEVKDIRHEGSGCSICCSSASVLSALLKRRPVEEAQYISTQYVNMVSGQSYDTDVELEDAEAYQGVKQFPARIKCATIAWQAFEDTLGGDDDE